MSPSHPQAAPDTTPEAQTDWIMPLLVKRDIDAMRSEFARRFEHQGLENFVTNTVAPLNSRIGQAWANGEISVFEEHLYTELIQNQLRSAIFALPRSGQRPQVLLTTLTGEEHQLGLLMVEALLCAQGAWCLSLGAQTPLNEIIDAATATTTDIVALSFSSAYPSRKAEKALLELRSALPPAQELWAGGKGIADLTERLPGIRCLGSLSDIQQALDDWFRHHAERRLRI